ncbi:unnamed protein product [Phaeothamnion confervicola]
MQANKDKMEKNKRRNRNEVIEKALYEYDDAILRRATARLRRIHGIGINAVQLRGVLALLQLREQRLTRIVGCKNFGTKERSNESRDKEVGDPGSLPELHRALVNLKVAHFAGESGNPVAGEEKETPQRSPRRAPPPTAYYSAIRCVLAINGVRLAPPDVRVLLAALNVHPQRFIRLGLIPSMAVTESGSDGDGHGSGAYVHPFSVEGRRAAERAHPHGPRHLHGLRRAGGLPLHGPPLHGPRRHGPPPHGQLPHHGPPGAGGPSPASHYHGLPPPPTAARDPPLLPARGPPPPHSSLVRKALAFHGRRSAMARQALAAPPHHHHDGARGAPVCCGAAPHHGLPGHPRGPPSHGGGGRGGGSRGGGPLGAGAGAMEV